MWCKTWGNSNTPPTCWVWVVWLGLPCYSGVAQLYENTPACEEV